MLLGPNRLSRLFFFRSIHTYIHKISIELEILHCITLYSNLINIRYKLHFQKKLKITLLVLII